MNTPLPCGPSARGPRLNETSAIASWIRAGGLLLLLAVFPWILPAAEEPLDNVVILLDASGSMAERMPGTNRDKLSVARDALKEVLRQLPESTRVGLLVFGGGTERTDDWYYPLSARDDTRLFAAIDATRAGRGTPLGAYIKRAADRLLEERRRQLGYGTFRLLIVSDGEAQDQDLVNRYTPEVMARGITMDVIGVAMASRHTLATRVHSYRTANDEESLRRALREVLAEVGSAADDLAGNEAFALLEPIPSEVAEAALQALATSGNQPIGERAPPPRREESAPAAEAAPPPETGAAPTEPPGPAAPPPAPSTKFGFSIVVLLFGLACFGSVVLVMLAIVRRVLIRSGGRRR